MGLDTATFYIYMGSLGVFPLFHCEYDLPQLSLSVQIDAGDRKVSGYPCATGYLTLVSHTCAKGINSTPFTSHLGTRWSSRSSSPWSWRSLHRSSMCRTLGPSSSRWWSSSGLCLGNIFPSNPRTPNCSFREQKPPARNTPTPQRIPSRGSEEVGQAGSSLWFLGVLLVLMSSQSAATLPSSWSWEVEIPTRHNSAKTALPQEPLWPRIPVSVSCVQPLGFPPEAGLQSNLQHRTPHSSADQTPMSLLLCVYLSELVSLPSQSEHLPPVDPTQEETIRNKGGLSRWVWCVCSLSCVFFIRVILISAICPTSLPPELVWPPMSAMPRRSLPP